jgi:flagellar FliJ protein
MGHQFKLEALRRYRQFQEDELQRELAEVTQRKALAQSKLHDSMEKLKQAQEALYRQQSDSTEGCQLAIFPRYLQRMTQTIDVQQQQVTAIEHECSAIRQALIDAVQKRKTLEKLKENELKAYLAELSQAEQKFISEIAINRYNLKQR